jgi:hypothetical protein
MLETVARTCHDLPSANKAVEKYLKPHFYAIVTEHLDRVLSGNLRQDLEDIEADLVYIRKDSDYLLSKEIRRDGVKLL